MREVWKSENGRVELTEWKFHFINQRIPISFIVDNDEMRRSEMNVWWEKERKR
jgi:hypothetical protein